MYIEIIKEIQSSIKINIIILKVNNGPTQAFLNRPFTIWFRMFYLQSSILILLILFHIISRLVRKQYHLYPVLGVKKCYYNNCIRLQPFGLITGHSSHNCNFQDQTPLDHYLKIRTLLYVLIRQTLYSWRRFTPMANHLQISVVVAN